METRSSLVAIAVFGIGCKQRKCEMSPFALFCFKKASCVAEIFFRGNLSDARVDGALHLRKVILGEC